MFIFRVWKLHRMHLRMRENLPFRRRTKNFAGNLKISSSERMKEYVVATLPGHYAVLRKTTNQNFGFCIIGNQHIQVQTFFSPQNIKTS